MDKKSFDPTCPVGATMKVLNGKWKIWILFMLSEKTMRFSELQKLKPGLTPRMLTVHLRELEEDGIVVRKVYPVIPPKVEYSLSTIGKTITPVLEKLQAWGACYLQKRAKQLKTKTAVKTKK